MDKTLIQIRQSLPSNPSHELDVDGSLLKVWAKMGSAYAILRPANDGTASIADRKVSGSVQDILQKEGWAPVQTAVIQDGQSVAWPNPWYLRWAKIWQYWITAPKNIIEGVRAFVAATGGGGLPEDWIEHPAQDGSGSAHIVCSFSITMEQARSLGAEQRALTSLASLPDGVHFFQKVAPIDGFSGVRKKSRQPTMLKQALYEPGDLFQTSHPSAGDARGTAWSESDVLSVTGLTLI